MLFVVLAVGYCVAATDINDLRVANFISDGERLFNRTVDTFRISESEISAFSKLTAGNVEDLSQSFEASNPKLFQQVMIDIRRAPHGNYAEGTPEFRELTTVILESIKHCNLNYMQSFSKIAASFAVQMDSIHNIVLMKALICSDYFMNLDRNHYQHIESIKNDIRQIIPELSDLILESENDMVTVLFARWSQSLLLETKRIELFNEIYETFLHFGGNFIAFKRMILGLLIGSKAKLLEFRNSFEALSYLASKWYDLSYQIPGQFYCNTKLLNDEFFSKFRCIANYNIYGFE